MFTFTKHKRFLLQKEKGKNIKVEAQRVQRKAKTSRTHIVQFISVFMTTGRQQVHSVFLWLTTGSEGGSLRCTDVRYS